MIPTNEESVAYMDFIQSHCFRDDKPCPLYSFDLGGQKCKGAVIGLQEKRCKRERDT